MSVNIVVTQTRYLWCGQTICQARDGSDNVTADYYPQGELHGTQAHYYVKNELGSIIGVLDSHGYALGNTLYGPYGTDNVKLGAEADFGYAGMLRHTPTGLYLTKYRAYEPETGRWLSRDPIGVAGGVNLYGYVGDDPVNLVDDLGLASVSIDYYEVVGGGVTIGYNDSGYFVSGRLGVGAGGGIVIDPSDNGPASREKRTTPGNHKICQSSNSGNSGSPQPRDENMTSVGTFLTIGYTALLIDSHYGGAAGRNFDSEGSSYKKPIKLRQSADVSSPVGGTVGGAIGIEFSGSF